MNKKAIEIAISTVVTLIIMIIIFSLSIGLIWQVYYSGEDIKKGIDVQTQNAINQMLFSENKKVALPKFQQNGELGQQLYYGLGIKNIEPGNTGKFQILVDFSEAYITNTPTEITSADRNFINRQWLKNVRNNLEEIAPFDKIIYTLYVTVDSKIANNQPTKAGTYVFNICVVKLTPEQSKISECTSDQKSETYDKLIHSMSVIVK